MLTEKHPELASDPGFALALTDSALIFYGEGILDISKNIEDWARFVRHAPPGHFYSPIPSFSEVLSRSSALFGAFPEALPGIDLNENSQERLFRTLCEILKDENLPLEPEEGWRYCASNGFYGLADGLMLHAMIRWLQPRRIVEVGSGWSSALILDTVDRHLGGDERLTFVEPFPERLHRLMRHGDSARVTIHEQPVQRVSQGIFEALEPGDLLFIDSSHVVTIGSDVPHLVGRILPILPSGVVVHVHDIFWPFEIPPKWFEEGRLWAEPYMWRAFLTSNQDWEIMLFNHWFVNARTALVSDLLPRMLTGGACSLWLRRRSE
jgi:predicted O-methyltransferase YrrM